MDAYLTDSGAPTQGGKTILIIEDNITTQRQLFVALHPQGYQLHFASSGEEGLQRCLEIRPDLILLDIILPGMDGFELCRQLLKFLDIPIIFLSIMVDDNAIVRGLEAGAVDYIEKPFSNMVLLARIRAALRHRAKVLTSSPWIKAATAVKYDDGNLVVNLDERYVSVAGKPINLTITEFNLLAYLIAHAGRVCTSTQILENVWGWDEGDLANIYTYVRRLRKKLEPTAESPRYFTVLHGVGYSFGPR
jgi:two-component system KDP operon response regulator KdpE